LGWRAISKSALRPYLPLVDIFIFSPLYYYAKKIIMFTKFVKICKIQDLKS